MRNRNFNLVLVGLLISLFGSAIQRFSFSLYLLDVTKDAAVFSNVIALSVLPYIFFAPFAGHLADTKNRKHIMIVLDFISFTVILAYVLLEKRFFSPVILTGSVMFLLSSITALYTPAVTAIIPEIVGRDNLVRANALVSQAGSAANLIGPVVAGILYGVLGIKMVTLLNAFSFFASALLELCIVYKTTEKKQEKGAAIGAFRGMKESFVYLKEQSPVNLKFIYSYGMFNIFVVPVMTILMPFVLRTKLGVSSNTYGAVEGVMVAGMIAGTFCITVMPKCFQVKNVHRWYYFSAAAMALMTISTIVFFHRSLILPWTIAGFFIMFATGIGNVVTMSYTQNTVEKERLGKVSAFSTAFATMTVPIGQVLFGWYLKQSDRIVPILLFALVCDLFVIFYIRRAVKKIDIHFV